MPIVPLTHFDGAGIDHIISLGAACETAYNLRRHYSFGTAYPFDWWISPTSGAARFIRDGDAAALYRTGDLTPTANGRSIVNVRYGIRLHHEFPHDRQVEGRPISANWAAHIASPQARTAHLARRFFSLASTGRNLMFVRSFGPRDTNVAMLQDLLEALDARFSPARIGVVLVNYAGTVPEAWPVTRAAVPRVAGTGWRGDAAAWDTALGSLGLHLTPGLHRPAAPDDLKAQIAANAMPEDSEMEDDDGWQG